MMKRTTPRVSKRLRVAAQFLARLARSVSRRLRERRRLVLKRFHVDPAYLRAAYFRYNGYSLRSLRRWAPQLYRRALEFGYLGWGRKIAEDVRDKIVLEVGCGKGTHAVAYAVVGVESYLGVDPVLDPDSRMAKDRSVLELRDFGWSPDEITRRLPHLRFLKGSWEELAPEGTFDVAIMHNVTEHLLQIETVFRGVRERIAPGGLLIFNHHNFYCWNGHHQQPKFVSQIDPDDPEQQKYVDWQHLVPEPGKDAHLDTMLNRIRLDELRALTEKLFEIETWDEVPIDADRGAGRLTPEIRARHPDVTERELTTQGVFCRARRPR